MQNLLDVMSGWMDPEVLSPLLMSWGGKLVAAVLILVIGRWIAKGLTGWFRKAVMSAQVDETLVRFLSSIVYMTLMVVVVISAVGALGVPTTSFLAIIGAAGLAIGLALKDSLSNFAAGVMLVFFRPFRAGDYIEAAGTSGSVESIRIFNTVLKTPDNRVITVPNALIYADTITNFSAEDKRRIDLVIGVSYDDDLKRARTLIEEVLEREDRVLKDPAPIVLVLELGESSVDFAVRPWVRTDDYWSVRGDLLEGIKKALEANGLSIPYPQRDVRMIQEARASA